MIVIQKARLIAEPSTPSTHTNTTTTDKLKKTGASECGEAVVGEKRPRGLEGAAGEAVVGKRVKVTNDRLNKIMFKNERGSTPIKFETLKIIEKGFVKPRNLVIITPQF